MFNRTSLMKSLALFCLAASPAFAVPLITDNDFVNADWTVTSFVIGPGGTIIAGQAAGSGNPAPDRDVRNNVLGGGSTLGGFHKYIAAGAFIDPAIDIIGGLSFSIDRQFISGLGTNVHRFGLAIEQGGVVYRAATLLNSGNSGLWVNSTQTLLSSDFVRADGSAGTPDFTCSGSLITVGFWSQSATQPADGPLNQRVQYDNFSVSVNPPAPSALVHEWNFERNVRDNAGPADGVPNVCLEYRSAESGDDVPFELGAALHFAPSTGVSSIATVPMADVHTLGVNNFTIAFWWKNEAADTGNGDGILDSGNSAGWRMQLLSTNRIRFADVAANATFDSVIVSTGEWQHVAFVCDRAGTGMCTWYINGVPGTPASSAGMGNIVQDQDLLIGRLNDNGQTMDGMIAKLQLYSSALTLDQVRALAGVSVPCLGDANGDMVVNFSDVTSVLANFNVVCP